MRSVQWMQEIVNELSYHRADNEPVVFSLHELGQEIYLQVEVMAPDNSNIYSPKVLQKGRKWRMSRWMCKNEVVQTAYKAIKTFEEHEIQERFKYKKRAIYNSHIDVDALHKIADVVDVREEVLAVPV